MQWRRRRLVIAIISTGLIFGDDARDDRAGERLSGRGRANAVDSMGVDTFVIKAGAAGPLPGCHTIRRRSTWPGWPLRPASSPRPHWPVPRRRSDEGTSRRNVTAFGAPEHGPGMPHVSEGRPPSTPDEVAASSTLGRHVGDDLQVGARTLADRRHRAQFHRTGQDAQHLPDDRGLAATGIQRAADHHVDRDRRRTPTAPGRLPDRRSSGRCQRPAAPGEGRGECRSRSWPFCCGSWRC